jgi:hypothetical protein
MNFGSEGVVNQLEEDYLKNFRRTLSVFGGLAQSAVDGELEEDFFNSFARTLCRLGGLGAVCGGLRARGGLLQELRANSLSLLEGSAQSAGDCELEEDFFKSFARTLCRFGGFGGVCS